MKGIFIFLKTWVLAFISVFLFPLMSISGLLDTTYGVPSRITMTTSAGNAEHTVTTDSARCGEGMANAQACSLLGFSRNFNAPKRLGFGSSGAFNQFGKTLNSGLADAGFDGTKAILQGSAVTGKNFRTGKAFDAASDFDIALAGSSILARAKQLGIGLRSGGTRTGPLTNTQINQLGLGGLRSTLQNSAGREVNFMIFGDAAKAAARAPSIGF